MGCITPDFDPDSCYTSSYALSLLQGLVHPEAMKRYFTLTNGAINSEAHDGTRKGNRSSGRSPCGLRHLPRAGEGSKSFVDLLLENAAVQGSGTKREGLEALCNPSNYVGLSRERWRKYC
jgi:hypothetical protein